MNEQDIQKLREAGFSDDDIRDYMAQNRQAAGRPQAAGAAAPAATGDQGADLDPNAPSETLRRAREQGLPTEGRESSFFSDLATVGPVFLADNAGKIALGGGGAAAAYGANQLRKGMQARAGAQAAQAAAQQATAQAQMAQAQAAMEQARAAQMQSQGLQERFTQRQAAQAARAAPPAPQILDAQGRPIVRAPVVPTGPMPSGPVAPTAMAPAVAPPVSTAPVAPVAPGSMPTLVAGEPPVRPPVQPGMLDRAGQMVRAVAANKVVQGAARMGNIAGIASMLLAPGNAGQEYPFPQSGPLRGSELNPATGRPWTPEELAAYRAQYGR